MADRLLAAYPWLQSLAQAVASLQIDPNQRVLTLLQFKHGVLTT
jgi:hypothetical protein